MKFQFSMEDKVHWTVFNEFLDDVSKKVHHQEPGTEAVFLFDNAPAHRHDEAVVLASSEHSMKRLPPYSPFFNPIEETFSKFKADVKTFLAEESFPDTIGHLQKTASSDTVG
ncbi:hypothetical protein HPB49_003109 [Dermacentor silvarum]|uniref:Uncharacterized protein n=1 Tax=Dermacentor silvarum TaxID=543639 RepID=A0ACB8DAC2_DERSI|nr:hypothetical protein HPB49_003109 [Dermacentor silvarum]